MIDERYKIGEAIGSGATSEVFIATDTKLRREVAFKRLLDHVAEDPTVRKCFHREAQALAKIRHKNVVAVHDYSGPEEQGLFLIMDLVRGKNLAAWQLERPKLDEPMVWALMHELGSALDACHALGVVHRDLKPENIIVNTNGRLILVDFGVARSYDAADGAVGAGVGTQVMGTPDYMSPEQATSSELTGASDVFSLGSVLYFMSSGKKPFEAEGVLATLKKIAAGNVTPLKQVRPELSSALVTAIHSCLTVEITKRPRAKDLVAEARRQLSALQLTPEALLADWVAAGAHGTGQKAKLKELDSLFAKLGAALEAKDKLEVKRARKRILELDPDNESVFDMRAPEPRRQAASESDVSTAKQPAPATILTMHDKPKRWPVVVAAVIGLFAGAAGMWIVRR